MSEYLKPGGLGRFLGLFSVIIQASFTFQGVELVAVAAAETESPRRNIGIAVRRVFWKIISLYMLSVLVIGLTVPSNHPDLVRRLQGLSVVSDSSQAQGNRECSRKSFRDCHEDSGHQSRYITIRLPSC